MRRDLGGHLHLLARYVVVGLVNSLVSLAAFLVLLWTGLHYALATLASGTLGVVLGFRFHGRWVFKDKGHGRFIHFLLIFSLMYGLSVGVQTVARNRMNGYAAGVLASGLTVPISFLLNRFFVYRGAAQPSEDRQAKPPG
jgi:putative flippase GtrA